MVVRYLRLSCCLAAALLGLPATAVGQTYQTTFPNSNVTTSTSGAALGSGTRFRNFTITSSAFDTIYWGPASTTSVTATFTNSFEPLSSLSGIGTAQALWTGTRNYPGAPSNGWPADPNTPVRFAVTSTVGGANWQSPPAGISTSTVLNWTGLSSTQVSFDVTANPAGDPFGNVFVPINDLQNENGGTASGFTGSFFYIPHMRWTAAGSGGWGTATNWNFGPEGILPYVDTPVTITSNNTLTVTGPTTSTSVKSLNLGTTGTGVVTLDLQSTGPLTVTGVTTVGSNGRLVFTGGTLNANGGVSLNSNVVANDSGTIAALNGNVNLNGGTRTFTIGNVSGATLNLSGAISNGGLIKEGPGILSFTGSSANTYSGTTINAGTINLQRTGAGIDNTLLGPITINAGLLRNSASNQIANSSIVTVNGGHWRLWGFNETVGGLSGSGGIVMNFDPALPSTLTINAAGNNTYNGSIQDSNVSPNAPLSLVIGGGANTSQTLGGNNSYTGTTTVNANSALFITHANALGSTSTGTTINNTGTVWVTAGVTVNEPLNVTGNGPTGGAFGGAALMGTNGANWAGPITLAGTSRVAVIDTASTFTIGGNISDGGNSYGLDLQMFNLSDRTLVLAGINNSYTGATTILNTGTLRVGAAGAIPDASVVNLNSGKLDLNNINETIGGLTGNSSSSVTLGSGTLTVAFNGSPPLLCR